MRHILVTGGFGYIGGRVAQGLALPGRHVVLGSRVERERPAWLPSASTTVIDWHDEANLRHACGGVDAVVHLAAVNEVEAARDPVQALEMTAVATARLIEAAKAEGVSRFIYFSTAHVYGAPLVGHIDEDVCPRPVHPYATSHRAAEDVILSAHDQGALTGVVLRVSNGYGAPAHADIDRWTLLANDLCRQAVTSGHLVLRSAGLQRRDFVALTDVSRAVEHVLNIAPDAVGNGIFNVGGRWAPTVAGMAALIAERCTQVLGFHPEISVPEPRPDEETQPLEYSVDKLAATGFMLSGDRNAEIDAMLRLCHQAFSSAEQH